MEAREAIQRLRELRRKRATFSEGAAQGAAEGIAGNLLGLPNVMAKIAERQTGVKLDPRQGLLGALPDTGREGLSSLQVGAENLLGLKSGNTGQRVMDEVQRRNQVQQDAPIGTAMGGVGADIATIAAGRRPFVRGPGGVLDAPINKGMNALSKATNAGKTGFGRFAKDIIDADTTRLIARGLGRSAETGIEGMALATLQDGDPVETAAMSAGAQMAASGGLTIANEFFDWPMELLGQKGTKFGSSLKGKAVSLAFNAGAAGALIHFVKTVIPGGKDFILESEEAAYDKMAAGLVLGMASVVGKRSLPDGAMKAFPKFADAINTIPRGAMISLIEDMESDEQTVSKTLGKMMGSPDAFSEKQANALNKGLMNGDFLERINELMDDEKFRNIITAPKGLEDVPVKDEDE